MLLAMMILDGITGIWMLLQYAYEVWALLGSVQGLSYHNALMCNTCKLLAGSLSIGPALPVP